MTMNSGSLRTHQDFRCIRFLPALSAVMLFVVMLFPAITTPRPGVLSVMAMFRHLPSTLRVGIQSDQ